jgi:hypothetical protein
MGRSAKVSLRVNTSASLVILATAFRLLGYLAKISYCATAHALSSRSRKRSLSQSIY